MKNGIRMISFDSEMGTHNKDNCICMIWREASLYWKAFRSFCVLDTLISPYNSSRGSSKLANITWEQISSSSTSKTRRWWPLWTSLTPEITGLGTTPAKASLSKPVFDVRPQEKSFRSNVLTKLNDWNRTTLGGWRSSISWDRQLRMVASPGWPNLNVWLIAKVVAEAE